MPFSRIRPMINIHFYIRKGPRDSVSDFGLGWAIGYDRSYHFFGMKGANSSDLDQARHLELLG